MTVTFRHATLDNGLTIIAETDPTAHTSACGFFVKTGARDESSRLMGVSHFLEHMMFKGTAQISADALNRAFDDVGAKNNAFTSTEMTCFYASSLPEHLGRINELLARMMRPALRGADFDTEKGVILEEIAMYKDNPFWVLYEAAQEKHFGGHSLSHRVLGTSETIKSLTRDEMERYFTDRYSSDNTVVALAGKLDFDQAVGEIAAVCGSWKRTSASRDRARPPAAGGRFVMRDPKLSRGYLLGLAEGPPIEDDRRYAAGLLAQILGASDNSRLHWALVETGIAEEAQAAFDAHDGVGQFFVYASGDPSRCEEIWATIEREIDNLVGSLCEDDLERLRNKIATAATVGGERPGDRMHRLGRLWTCLGVYKPLEEEIDRICGVSLSDLRELCAAYPLRPVTAGSLLPE